MDSNRGQYREKIPTQGGSTPVGSERGLFSERENIFDNYIGLATVFREYLRLAIGIVVAIPLIVSIITIIRLIGAISSVPVFIGQRIHIERWARRLVHHIVDIETALMFRDDILYVLEEHFELAPVDEDELDRWGLIRQAELSRNAAIEDLQNGELALSIGGSLISILAGLYVDVRLLGAGFAIVIVLFSILVILRVVITDLLSYRVDDLQHDPVMRIAIKKGWNESQIRHGTSLVLASILLTFSSTELGYDWGMRIVEWYGTKTMPPIEKRYTTG